MSLKRTLMIFGFPMMLAVTMPLFAQSGCVDSPEDPTIVLAVVGAAAVVVAGMRRNKDRGNRKTTERGTYE